MMTNLIKIANRYGYQVTRESAGQIELTRNQDGVFARMILNKKNKLTEEELINMIGEKDET